MKTPVSKIVLLWASVPAWTKEELKSETDDYQIMSNHLRSLGYEVEEVCLVDSVKKSVFENGFLPTRVVNFE